MSLQSILQRIYAATQTPGGVAAPVQQATPPVQGIAPTPQLMDAASNAPMALPAPVAAAAPQQAVNPSILGAIGRVLAPQEGSFMHAAWNGGLANANANRDAYPQQKAEAQALQSANLVKAIADAKRAASGRQAVGGVIVEDGPGGVPQEVYRPAPQASEQERLIDAWQKAPPGPIKDMYERTIRGYQYTDDVIEAQGAAKTQTAVQRVIATARNRAPTGGGARGITATARAKIVGDALAAIEAGAPEAAVRERAKKQGVTW